MAFRLRGLFRRRVGHRAEPLRGTPAIRREKGYAADSGFVYQYTYEGYRAAMREGSPGKDFVFRCTSDRSLHCLITVFARDATFSKWEREESRELSDVERYAIVKMHLFAIFDSVARIERDEVWDLGAADVREHVETLDL